MTLDEDSSPVFVADGGHEVGGVRGYVRQFLSLQRDVLVLSVAMLAFSLAFQMTSRYVPEYLVALGASGAAVGLFGSASNLVSAVYPYPGGRLSDRIGSRRALTLFGTASTAGFVVWAFADVFGIVRLGPWHLPTAQFAGVQVGGSMDPLVLPVGIFLGLLLTQAWKSLGLGATFAIVKQSTDDDLATGFASTETFRRTGFLLGPLIATAVLAATATFTGGFRVVLLVAAGFGAVATIAQHTLYDPEGDSIGKEFEGVASVIGDLRSLPATLRPLLVADTLVRFANGMVYVFFVLVVTRHLDVGLHLGPVDLAPAAFFGILLGVEMVIALLSMLPVSRLADRYGFKPVVNLGFAVYAVFPVVLIFAPANSLVLLALFAFSGLRFAGLPAHKALIVAPAQQGSGGTVTGAYYLARNVVVIPSAAIGGYLWDQSPELAFTVASAIGLLGVAYFAVYGREP